MSEDVRLTRLKKVAEESAILRRSVVDQLGSQILELAAVISGVMGAGGKLLIAGNGGSASDASHFAAEMIVRLTAERSRQALPAIALGMDPSVTTAAANDFGYEHVFARQVEGLGNKGDLLFVLSTSGNSPNLIKAATVARDRSMLSAALLGGSGGKLAKQIERSLIIPHTSTQRIQEEHIFIIHTLVELIEGDLFG